MSIFPAKILVGTDGSEEATLAAETAVALATRTGSKLHVLAAGPEYPYYELPDAPARFEEVLEEQKRATREVLDEQVARIEALGATVEDAHLTMGERPDRAIVDLAEKLGVGLIVVGSRGLGGLRRIAVGSVSDSVVRHAHCPVLVVRKDGQGFPPGRILLALDGSEQADSAARMAVELADRTGSELHVIHVGEVAPLYHPERHGYHAMYENLREHAKEVLEEQMEKIKAAGGSVSGSHLGIGRPDGEIVAHAEELGAGLIVVGSRGLGGIRRALMGSVSSSVVRHAHGSVLVVRKGG